MQTQLKTEVIDADEPMKKIGGKEFSELRAKTQLVLNRLFDGAQGRKNFDAETTPMARLFPYHEAAEMVGCSVNKIRSLRDTMLEKRAAGELGVKLPDIPIDSHGRMGGLPFAWVQAMRAINGTLPWREDNESPFVLSVSSFKGGASKTETVSNLSRYMALKGYRILVIDLDHQASVTGSYGYSPDTDFTVKDTIIPYIDEKEDSLAYAIKKTAWPNIDLIPSCMELDEFSWVVNDVRMRREEQLISSGASVEEIEKMRKDIFFELRRGIETVYQDYDVVLIDSPPSSSINAYEIIAASDGLVVPVPPRKHDMASTAQFLGIVEKLINGDKDNAPVMPNKEFNFVRFLVTQFVNEGNRSENDRDFFRIFKAIYGDACYDLFFRLISNIKEASANFTTVYEVEKPNRRIIKELDAVFGQIELDILRQWPSKKEAVAELEFERGEW